MIPYKKTAVQRCSNRALAAKKTLRQENCIAIIVRAQRDKKTCFHTKMTTIIFLDVWKRHAGCWGIKASRDKNTMVVAFSRSKVFEFVF